MSMIVQWVIAGACLAAAIAYLLYRLGLFDLLGWLKPRPGGACKACPHCPTAERIAARLTERK
jgi:hypothetical protein